ncbi:MAG: carbohydrate kinase [Bacteroidetes bacterium]|jgi:fructokinase|nr:carbohydrate kinase [Bacteroidota bacterium]
MSVVCFGEVLWDMLPGGKVAGGAPMNVAFHARNLGLDASLVSRVGQDGLGEELLGFLHDKGIPSSFVQRDAQHPTSTVEVKLDKAGHASYEIVAPVAWDFIELEDQAVSAARQSKALVFGSLAARSATSRRTLLSLLEQAPMKVFDVNLRPPHYSRALLETLLAKADLVKMNEEELATISLWYGDEKGEAAQMELLLKHFSLAGLLLTKGGDGAAFLGEQTPYTTQPAYAVQVKDTVGSGDSFLAAFLSKYLNGQPVSEALRFAAATGALVATRDGGTPVLAVEDIESFI